MEPQIQQTQPNQQPSIDTGASSVPNLPPARCQARNRNGSRCRLRARHTATALCARHADRAGMVNTLDDSLDLSYEILAEKEGAYDTTESINSILSNIVELVAQGRISPRRAAVITYALSLMLRSAVVADRQQANEPEPSIYSLPDPKREEPDPKRDEPFVPPTTPAEAIAAYERIRS